MRAHLAVVVSSLWVSSAACRPPSPASPGEPATVRVAVSVANPPPPVDDRPLVTAPPVLATLWAQEKPRGQQIEILEQLIADTPDSEVDEKSDYLFRLAKLHTIAAWALRDRATDAAASASQANATFAILVANRAYHAYPKMDEAELAYAATLELVGSLDQARAIDLQLLQEFPDSVHATAAALAVAELAYAARRFAEAETYYHQVAVLSAPPLAVFARYKLGWTLRREGRARDAVRELSRVAHDTRGDHGDQPLHDDAMSALVGAVAETGVSAHDALAMLGEVDKDELAALAGKLADHDVQAGKPDQAIAVYRALLADAPASPDRCAWLSAIARATAYARTGTPVEVCASDEAALRAWIGEHGGTISK